MNAKNSARQRPIQRSLMICAVAFGGLLTAGCTEEKPPRVPSKTHAAREAIPASRPARVAEPGTTVEPPLTDTLRENLPATAGEWVRLARRRLEAADPRGALEACKAALELEPGSASALHSKGRALWALDQGQEALVTLEVARRADPDDGYIANTLGYLLLTRGDAEGAIPHLEAARELLPRVAYVRNNLGVAYERAGRVDAAVEEYRAAVGAGDSGGKATASLARLGRSPAPTTDTVERARVDAGVARAAQSRAR